MKVLIAILALPVLLILGSRIGLVEFVPGENAIADNIIDLSTFEGRDDELIRLYNYLEQMKTTGWRTTDQKVMIIGGQVQIISLFEQRAIFGRGENINP